MRKRILHSENGFTLIEILIAMVVLTIGILALYMMQINAISGNARASRLTVASTWNAGQIETIIGLHYADADLLDDDGNGTGEDANNDGADDDGGDFGLDDTTGTSTADGSLTTADGRYQLYWNVAIGVPMKNLKTVRVHVIDTSQILSRAVAFTYIKADII